ncbi:hypothetical protein [Cupriavidus basilensis]|uniref:hypothetical protein n=1 Tax=Cupriavidus basilensis TaxID=68895 RepID=UPI001300CA40|nr:hypothetical protein [Cupriavidus basilensis]
MTETQPLTFGADTVGPTHATYGTGARLTADPARLAAFATGHRIPAEASPTASQQR